VRFLNRIGPAQFSEASNEGLNFYVLSHQIEKTPWDFAALNNVTVQFPGLTHRLQRLDPSLIQQSLHLVHGLADAFFTQDNLSLTRQIDGKLYSMEQIPYLNRFIKNTPVLNQSHIDRLNNFVAKFPKQGIPETSSMLSLSLLVLNKPYPSAAPTFTSLFSEQKIETLDERNLDDAAIIALHRELDLLLKPVSTSGKSIIKGIQEYAVPRFLSVKFERESKLKKNLASYQQILATMQQQAGSLRESLEDKNSTLTSQQKQTIRASLHDFKQRFSTEIIKPIKSINLKHTQVKLGDEVLNDTLTKAYMAVYTPLTMGGDNAKAADEQDEAKYSFGSR